MADDEDLESDVKDKRNHSRSDTGDSDRRSRENDRQRRHRDIDRTRDEDSRNSRRRSRSRSGSRERTSSNRSGRDGSRNGDRRHSHYDDGGASGNSRRGGSLEGEEVKVQSKRDRRDDDVQSNERITGHDWRSKLTSIRDAHFNRSKKAPTLVQNQFKNDGSFLEMFKKKMAEQTAKGGDKSSLTPNSLVLASSSIPFSPELSLPPLTTAPLDGAKLSSAGIDTDQDLDGVPMPTHKSLPVPVSVGKRRLAKPLKTGIVIKKPQEPEEDEASQEKLDSWSRYLQEVQKYKSSNCIDEDSSRPLVK